jgi:hypothetical protein
MADTGAGKSQIIAVVVLSVVLVIVGAWRLTGGDDVPAKADAAIAQSTVDAGTHLTTAEVPADFDPDIAASWNLPSLQNLFARADARFQPPENDPFVFSDTIRVLVEGAAGQPTLQPEESQNIPAIAVRSVFAVGAEWRAEIDNVAYRAGDIVYGHRITRITPDAIWVRPDGESEPESTPGNSAEHRPTCLITVNGVTSGAILDRWYAPGRQTAGGVVRSVTESGVEFVPHDPNDGAESELANAVPQPTDIEIRIQDDE